MNVNGEVEVLGHSNLHNGSLTTSPQKNGPRLNVRGGHSQRGGSKNRTWVAGGLTSGQNSRSQSRSPAPTEGRWERGGHTHRGSGRGRPVVHGHGSHRQTAQAEGEEEVVMTDVEGGTGASTPAPTKTWEEVRIVFNHSLQHARELFL